MYCPRLVAKFVLLLALPLEILCKIVELLDVISHLYLDKGELSFLLKDLL